MQDKHTIDPNRLYWIDAVRSFACLCVLLMHSVEHGAERGHPAITAVLYAAVGGASILFFMISGALVFYKPKPLIPFMKRRLSKIALPMVLWTLVALLISCSTGRMAWGQLPQALIRLPFTPQFGTYWFIYVIMGIYLLTPMVATWLERCSRRDVEILLAVGAMGMIIPYLTPLDKRLAQAMTIDNGALYYFGGYLWIALAGYYFRKYVTFSKLRLWHVIAIAAVIAMPIVLQRCGLSYNIIKKRTTLNMVLLCASYFLILKHTRLTDRMKRVVYDFARHSFGIYLVHNLFNIFLLFPLAKSMHIPTAASMPMVWIASLVLSYLTVHLLSKLPYSQYYIGLDT